MTTPSGDPTEPAADDASKPAARGPHRTSRLRRSSRLAEAHGTDAAPAEQLDAPEDTTAQIAPSADQPAPPADATAQLPPPAEPPATAPELPAAPQATPAYTLPPAGSQPSQAETDRSARRPRRPPRPRRPRRRSPPRRRSSPRRPTACWTTARRQRPRRPRPRRLRRSRASRAASTAPCRCSPPRSSAASSRAASSPSSTAPATRRSRSPTRPAPAAADAGHDRRGRRPAPPASSEQLPATPPPASSEQDQQPTAPTPAPASSARTSASSRPPSTRRWPGRVRLGTDSGVMIAGIAPGSPADSADLEAADSQITIDGQQYSFGGDTITAIDGQQVTSVDQLRQIIGSHKPGDTVKLTVVNASGDERTVDVTLGERPADQQQETPSCSRTTVSPPRSRTACSRPARADHARRRLGLLARPERPRGAAGHRRLPDHPRARTVPGCASATATRCCCPWSSSWSCGRATSPSSSGPSTTGSRWPSRSCASAWRRWLFAGFVLAREGTLRIARRDVPLLLLASLFGIFLNQLCFMYATVYAEAGRDRAADGDRAGLGGARGRRPAPGARPDAALARARRRRRRRACW